VRYPLLNYLVDPASGQPFRVVESVRTIPCSAADWTRCTRWCGRYGQTPDQVDPSACEPCLQEEVVEGTLQSEAGAAYPILRGIPRILDDSYLALVEGLPADWVKGHRKPSVSRPSEFESVQIRTVKAFAEEWRYFSENLSDYGPIAQCYFDLLSPKQLAGVTLDAGCGMGRWARHVAGPGDALIAMDLSASVEVAAKTLEGLPNTHVVQSDLHALPFRPDTFDLIYSLGVLHHLPVPEQGLKALVKHLRPDGYLLAYFYYALDNRPRYFHYLLPVVMGLRLVISRLPHRLALWISFVIALALYWPLIQVGNLLRALGFKAAARQVPLHEFYTGKPFRILFNDSVDRFATSVEFRFSRTEIAAMLARVGLSDIRFSDTVPFWKVAAKRKPAPMPPQ